jgi:hypothetical protein
VIAAEGAAAAASPPAASSAVQTPDAEAPIGKAMPTAVPVSDSGAEAQSKDSDAFEFAGEMEPLTFAEDGVGIVSVYDEAGPVWRDLGFARGEVSGPKGLPLRIAVNLSLRTAVEAMDEGPRRQFERMDDSQINRAAAAALVPLEHQFLRPLSCPRCGNKDHLNLLQQESIAGEYHPDLASWPYSAPGGDRYTLGCPQCDFLFEVVFWFYE